MTDAEIVKTICPLQTRERFIHSLNVADMAKKLAERYGEDPKKAYTAGLIHDATKNISGEEQLALISSGGIELSELEKNSPKLWHAVSGSVFAVEKFGIDDADIINAVRYHTTGRAGMSMLEKIIYVADFISAERDYEGVEDIRRTAFESLEKAVYIGADFTVKKLNSLSLPVHPDTQRARQFYKIYCKD